MLGKISEAVRELKDGQQRSMVEQQVFMSIMYPPKEGEERVLPKGMFADPAATM